MKFTREVKTALLAIIAIILLIFGYSFLQGKNLLEDSRIFYAVYDNVEGLAPSSEVTINGLKVGNVTEIDFLDREGNLLVTFTVNKDFVFSENSIARVYGGGLIGGKSLEIVPKYEEGNIAESGDTLKGDIEEGLLELVNERLTPLQEKVEQVFVDADSLLTAVNQILDEDTRHGLKASITEFHKSMVNVRQASQSLETILVTNEGKIDSTFTNINEMSVNLNRFSDSLSQIEIARMANELENAISEINTITTKINQGDGTVAKLINDDDLYNNLERATRQLEQLLQDIKLNPKRYLNISVFGKDNEPYDPPEDPLK